jgi:primase-like protein/bifunctional DNA primase/polymerase-like protein
MSFREAAALMYTASNYNRDKAREMATVRDTRDALEAIFAEEDAARKQQQQRIMDVPPNQLEPVVDCEATSDEVADAKSVAPSVPPPMAAVIATKFIKAGGHVIFFPCGTKRCTLPGWEQKATNNLEAALAWAGQDPSANVGIVGKQDGLWGCDDDAGLIAEYEAQYGPIQTYTTRTVSGGRHFIFRQSAESWAMGNVSIEDADGHELLSARVSNRYVVAAGSWAYPNNDTTKPLTQYTAVDPNAPFIEAPSSLIAFIKVKEAEKGRKSEKPKSDETRIYHEGGRNNALTRKAGQLRQAGTNPDEILAILSRMNQEICVPPLPEHEVESIAKSIGRYPVGKDKSLDFTQKPDALPATNQEASIPVIEDESDTDTRFDMTGDTFDTSVYEKLAERSTPYPVPSDSDLISILAKKLVHGTSIPLAYVREPLKAAVLHTLDGKLAHHSFPKMSLRGNYFSLGESEGGKTTGLEFALEVADTILKASQTHAENLFRYKSETTFIRSFTPEGTLKRDTHGNVKSGRAGHASQFLYIKEGNLVANSTDYFAAVFSQLTNLYDQTEAGTESMTNGDFTARTVKTSTVMCFTPSDFKDTFGGKGTIGGGGLNRWGLVNPVPIRDYDDKDWERLSDDVLAQAKTALTERVFQLIQGDLQGDCIVLTEEPEAIKVRLEVKAMLKKLGAAGKRLMDYFMREQIAMAATSTDGRLIMTEEQARYAKAWVEAQIQCRLTSWPSDAANQIEQMEHAIRKAVNTHFVSETKLRDACHFYRQGSGGWFVYKTALANAIDSGAVKWTGRTRKKMKVYCPGSCAAHLEIKEEEK